MPYTLNPNLPRVRMQAVKLIIRDKWSTRKVARYLGFNQSTIVGWVKRAPGHLWLIPTKSSRSKSHPSDAKLLTRERYERIKIATGKMSFYVKIY